MRPSVGKLIFKLKNLKSLKEHPDSVPFIIQMLAHHYFVHEAQRPDLAYQAFDHLHKVWQGAMGYPSSYDGTAAKRQLEVARESEEAQNAVTGDELPEKLSLSAALREEVQPGVKKRNNVSPGPSHKSPIAYADGHDTGFTIPGVDGKFVWKKVEKTDALPSMLDVVEILAAGLKRGRSPDLEDKGLKKRVRELIWNHTPEFDDPKPGITSCTCGKQFDIGEEWSTHVRKLIWKELKP